MHRILWLTSIFGPLCFAPAPAQQPAPPIVPLQLPKEVTGLRETPIDIIADTKGKAVRWRAVDPGIVLLWDLPDLRANKKAIVLGCRPGRYRVEAWSSINDEPTPIVACTVIISEPNPPPLPPDPKPPLPEPVDPLMAKFQTAYDADAAPPAAKKGQLVLMIGLYQAMAEHAGDKTIKSTGDLLSDYKATAGKVLLPGLLVELRRVIAAEIAAAFGTDSIALDDATRKKAIDHFDKIAKALGGVK